MNESPYAVSVDGLWASTEAGIAQFMSRMDDMRAAMGAYMGGQREAPQQSSLLSVANGVGVIQIQGPISAQGSVFDAMFGVTSYPAIRQALVQAAGNADVKSIMLDINSPGGQVTGVADTAELIRMVGTIKPVAAHTSGDMTSAAYWLGSQASTISASPTSQVGSIGTIYTHKEVSRALDKEGVTVTVLREGDFKALASPFEPLSDKAKGEIQSQMKASTGVFMDHVAAGRGKSAAVVDATMGQGRVFVGEAAKSVGLIDNIQSFDQAMAAAAELGAQKPKANSMKSLSENRMTQQATLSAEQVALAALGAVEMTAEQTATQEAAAVAQEATESARVAAEVVESARVAAEAAALEPSALQATIATLNATIAANNSQLLDAMVAKKIAEDKAATLAAAVAPLQAIVEKSMKGMTVALRGTFVETARTPEAALAEHAALETAFNKKFVVGGVAAVSEPVATNEVASANHKHMQRVKAVGLNQGVK